jgi:hypothetical protein
MGGFADGLEQDKDVFDFALHSVGLPVPTEAVRAAIKGPNGEAPCQGGYDKVPGMMIAEAPVNEKQRRTGALTPIGKRRSITRLN